MKRDNPVIGHIFSLLRAGLWERAEVCSPGLSLPWQEILTEARRQDVLGLVCEGAKFLPQEMMPSHEFSVDMLMDCYKTERRSAYVQDVSGELFSFFNARGLSPLVQKGPDVARYYARPLMRVSGDIDFYFHQGEFALSRDALMEKGVGIEELPDGSLLYGWKGVTVEHHSRFYDSRCQFDEVAIPSPEATLLMLSTHILKHAMGPGIGLKQICDMTAALKALGGQYDRDLVTGCLNRAGLMRWQGMLDAFMARYLGLDEEFLLTAGMLSIRESPQPLLKIVLKGGSFGYHDPLRRTEGNRWRRKVNTFIFFLQRIPFAIRVAPREWLHTVGELVRGNLSL